MAIINLSKSFRIETDERSYNLQYFSVNRWRNASYCSTLENAIKNYYNKRCLRLKGTYDLNQYLSQIKKIQEELCQALRPYNIEVKHD